MNNKEYASSLRLIADFYEQNPTMPLPSCNLKVFSTNTREQFAHAARLLGACDKDFTGETAYLRKKFGDIVLEVVEFRDKVCVRKVVGVEHIERKVIPEQVIPEHDKEIVEWDCRPLLEENDEGFAGKIGGGKK